MHTHNNFSHSIGLATGSSVEPMGLATLADIPCFIEQYLAESYCCNAGNTTGTNPNPGFDAEEDMTNRHKCSKSFFDVFWNITKNEYCFATTMIAHDLWGVAFLIRESKAP